MSLLKLKITEARRQRVEAQDNRHIIQQRQPEPPRAIQVSLVSNGRKVLKNYSRVFTTFALSPIAYPYLSPILQQYNINQNAFFEFVECRKSTVKNFKDLKEQLVVVKDTDSAELTVMRKVFQHMCIVFLRFFCVNWIFNTNNIASKALHLSYRLKVLRRIQNTSTHTEQDN